MYLHEIMSLYHNDSHATAYPGSDALRLHPVDEMRNNRTGTRLPSLSHTFNLRKQFYVGCWNVRTLLDTGSQCLTMRSLFDYRIDIACLSEVRIAGCGSKCIKVPGVDTEYWLHYSGVTDNSGLHGVAFALSRRAFNSLIAWTPISPRIAVARFKGTPTNLTVIAIYAPTLNSDAETVADFYEQLQNVTNNVPRRDMLIIAGDWNARVGPADQSTRHILGKFGLGQRCSNGNHLINFADYNHMVVANTRFQHPRKHLITWYSNDGRTAHQLDYILIRSRWISSVEDCRSYRGADTGNRCGSDHTLVRAKVQLRLTTRRKLPAAKRFNVALLDDPVIRELTSAAITSNLTSGENETASPNSVDDSWLVIKTAIHQAADAHLGRVTRRSKDWISARTMLLSAKAKDARLNSSPEYRQLRRQASRSARDDRNAFWAEMATAMETASNVGDFGTLYRLIRSSSGSSQPISSLLRDDSGELITEQDAKIRHWVDYFTTLLNRPPVTTTASFGQAAVPYVSSCEPPTRKEISEIISKLKLNKSPGEDGIPPKLIKACQEAFLDPFCSLLHLIWDKEVCPADWHMSVLIPVPKKGDKSKCENYRGISLIDVAAKIFSAILLNRFSAERDLRVRPNQGGFRPGRGCTDQIFTLRRVLEHRYKYQQPTITCFIDFKAAFDSVARESLWNIMLEDGVPAKLVNLIRAYYASTKSRIRVYGEESTEFDVTSGVRQGCPLSPSLFNFAVDWIMKQAVTEFPGVQINNHFRITDLEYADDVVILGDNFHEVQQMLELVNRFASQIGLQINVAKTKYFSSCIHDSDNILSVGGETIESVDCFKYLGSTILPTGQAFNEIELRINHGRAAFLRLKKALWTRREINLKTKARVYQATIRSVLLYGCETWPLREEDIRRLEVFDHWCLRRILRINWRDRLSNAEIRKRFFTTPQLRTTIQKRRLQWLGHVLRKPDQELTKQALLSSPCPGWRCRRGGQLKTWLNTVKADLDVLGLHAVYGVRQWSKNWLNISLELASDRKAWNAIIRDINGAGSS